MFLFVLGLIVTEIAVKNYFEGLTKWRFKFGYFKNLTISESSYYFRSEIPQGFLLSGHYISCLLSK